MADARNMIQAGAAPGALAPLPASALLPSLVMNSGERARVRFLEFFAGQIRNTHTRRAYARAAAEFLMWCLGAGVTTLPQVQPMHVAAWIELQGRKVSAPSVKQHLAAVRHRFDWLVTGHIVDVNPAASVRGPRHVARSGKTSVLAHIGRIRQVQKAWVAPKCQGILALLISTLDIRPMSDSAIRLQPGIVPGPWSKTGLDCS
jgi:hypothetical protein